MKLKTEEIIEDAETAATFFRALCDKGVQATAAASLTSSYLVGVMGQRIYNQKPREPWETDGQ